jgi:hypothetical protein
MGEDKPPSGERMAVLETQMVQARADIQANSEAIRKLQEKPSGTKLTMQEWLIIAVVLANFALTIFKGIGWSP